MGGECIWGLGELGGYLYTVVVRWFFFAKKFAHEVFDVGENGGRGKYMLKNFFFSCRLVAAIWVGFENMMPGMKLFFLRVITNSFVVPCTQCVKFCLSLFLEIKGTRSAWNPIFSSNKDLF